MASFPIGRKILSIDGCGFRGRTQLLVLQSLMKQMNNPKPCDVFDLICGTAAGGLIAILLGRLKMSCDDAIKAYDDLEEGLFGGVQVSDILSTKEFATRAFQTKLMEIVKKHSGGNDFFVEKRDPRCKTFVTVVTRDSFDDVDPTLLRSYSKPLNPYRSWRQPDPQPSPGHKWETWQAAIGSTSCPRLFQALDVNSSLFQAANASGFANPSMAAYIEALDLWGPNAVFTLVSLGMGVRNRQDGLDDWQTPGPLDDRTINDVVVGLGIKLIQGSSETTLKEFIRQTKRVATNTQVKDIRLNERTKSAGPHHMYYRFDPPSTHSKGLVLVDHGKDLRQAIDKAAEVFIQSDLKLRTSQLKLAAGKLQIGATGYVVPSPNSLRVGGNGDTNFDGFLPTVGARLKRIKVWTKTDFLCAIELIYSFEGRDFSAGRLGGHGGDEETPFNLDPGEFIVRVQGTAGSVIRTLRFTKQRIGGTPVASSEYGSNWGPSNVLGNVFSSAIRLNIGDGLSTIFGSLARLLTASNTPFTWNAPSNTGLGWFTGTSGELIDSLTPAFVRQDCVLLSN